MENGPEGIPRKQGKGGLTYLGFIFFETRKSNIKL